MITVLVLDTLGNYGFLVILERYDLLVQDDTLLFWIKSDVPWLQLSLLEVLNTP